MKAFLRDALRELEIDLPSERRVLLVDDEPENLFVLEALLDDDFEVLTAESGAAALACIEHEGEVDLIVTDQRMPGLTGVEMLSQVATDHPDTIRIVVTGYTDVEPMVAAINQGAIHRFILKPWNAEEMRAAVEEAFDVRSTKAALRLVVDELARRCEALRFTLQELEHTNRQVLAAERLSTLGRLTAGITHDIRNQANVMLLLVESVNMETEDPAVHDAANVALSTLRSLVNLVHDVNVFASDHARELKRSPVEARQFVEETIKFLSLEGSGQNSPVAVHVDPAVSELYVAAQPMRQGLLSLLRNAVQATQPADPIEVRVVPASGRGTNIDVRDRGPGMDPETLALSTKPFFSGFEPPGMGLGLEIARLVVEAHGGRLEIYSEKGAGTLGRLWLPPSAPVHTYDAEAFGPLV